METDKAHLSWRENCLACLPLYPEARKMTDINSPIQRRDPAQSFALKTSLGGLMTNRGPWRPNHSFIRTALELKAKCTWEPQKTTPKTACQFPSLSFPSVNYFNMSIKLMFKGTVTSRTKDKLHLSAGEDTCSGIAWRKERVDSCKLSSPLRTTCRLAHAHTHVSTPS